MSFQAVSGLNINLTNSELVKMDKGEILLDWQESWDVKVLELLIKYLGLPLGTK